jgi:aspartokinase/homoserine dehydrogenase 1
VIAHKFGGSSVADAERMRSVVSLLSGRNERQVVVISAMKGVTDALIGLVHKAAARDAGWPAAVHALEARHLDTAAALLGPDAGRVTDRLRQEFAELREVLHTQARLGAPSADLLDAVSGLGEVWSSMLVEASMRIHGLDTRWIDAREVLVVEKGELGAMVDWPASQARLEALPAAERTVVTGFVARTREGRPTTLGRNGSDYSGAIFAALCGASELHLWSDVEGVFSADPRVVPEAVLIERLSYAEACELAYFGAKVIHPQTMAPAVARDIPIIARSSFHPEHPGTRIDHTPGTNQPVKGVTHFAGLAILDIEGAGMIGVPGTAERAFAALHRAGVSVSMISQGSSEHSICCVIRETDAPAAVQAVRQAFSRELEAGLISEVTSEPGIAALAVVGDGMAGHPGTAGRLFESLGRAGVNVRMIAQGASERNISVAIRAADADRALRAVHAGFYLSPHTISVGVIGVGTVGAALLRQLQARSPSLRERHRIDLRMRAVAGSRQMHLAENVRGSTDPRSLMDRPLDLDAFTRHVQSPGMPHAVIVDCSGSDAVADRYATWLAAGIHVITPSKCAGSGPLTRYRAIRSAGGLFRYEATVGAGLPIMTTVRDLLDTGDELQAVEGVLSGTLAWLFNRFDGSVPFGQLVLEAREHGFTEPDPRDDLSGLDVARKLVILVREAGWERSLEDVSLESLVPADLRSLPLADFLARVDALDAPMRLRLEQAKARGRVLRYTASLDRGGGMRVGLAELPADHALAHLRLTDNMVQFTTTRYAQNPLVVQGPGAGPDVTAAGVFADLLRVAVALGARL